MPVEFIYYRPLTKLQEGNVCLSIDEVGFPACIIGNMKGGSAFGGMGLHPTDIPWIQWAVCILLECILDIND